METRKHIFSEQIAEMIAEIRREFQEVNPEDPIEWFKEALKKHCLVKDEEVQQIAKELISGIIQYKKTKKLSNPLELHKDKINAEDLKILEAELDLMKSRIKEEVQTWKKID